MARSPKTEKVDTFIYIIRHGVAVDPRPHTRDTTAETAGPGTGETAEMRPERLGDSVAPGTPSRRGGMQGGSAHRQDGGSGEAHGDALTARRPAQDLKDRPHPGSGAHTVRESRDGEGTRNSFPQEPVPATGCPVSCPGEVLLWQP